MVPLLPEVRVPPDVPDPDVRRTPVPLDVVRVPRLEPLPVSRRTCVPVVRVPVLLEVPVSPLLRRTPVPLLARPVLLLPVLPW